MAINLMGPKGNEENAKLAAEIEKKMTQLKKLLLKQAKAEQSAAAQEKGSKKKG